MVERNLRRSVSPHEMTSQKEKIYFQIVGNLTKRKENLVEFLMKIKRF